MSVEIVVPNLGESVSQAIIARWFKQPGDAVNVDEAVCELETDKVTMEVFSSTSGVITALNASEGQTVSVGAAICVIDESATAAPKSSSAPKSAAPAAPTPAPAPAIGAPSAAGVFPSAQKIAAEKGVDTSGIQGTGKDGRVTKGDVLAAGASPSAVSGQPGSAAAASRGGEERVRMTTLRRRIAERLKESQNTAAILTTFNEIDMSNLKALRDEHKDMFEKKHGVRLGFMSFFVKAVVEALKEVPVVNAHVDGEYLVYKHFYDIGVAVGTEQGLVVPILRDADKMSIADVERAIAGMAAKARDGKLSMQDLTGGTFTISNGGVYGSLMSTPIINPPQSGILGMHKVEDRPVVVGGQIVIRPMMYVALSYDHRLIDGKDSVTFLVKVKEYVEDPRRLLLS
jgi:2-oxoglutarate dehydrogenase E2 component (dihydrolipoamide succinyltransferase)